MKPKRKIISLLLAICLVAGLLPQVAFAAGTDTGKAIQLVDSGTAANISGGQADNIYFGTWEENPIKWRVLDDQTNTGGSGLFLLSDALLGTGSFGDVYFDNSGNGSNVWQGSTAQDWCRTFYNGNFSEGEQGAVLATTKSDGAFTSSTYSVPFAASENILNGDKVFFLSAEEAENSAYGFTDDNTRIANYGNSAGVWWLRSPNAYFTDFAGAVFNSGDVNYLIVRAFCAARPAFNLDLNSVLFTSAAEGGKIPAANGGGNQGGEAADAIFEIGDYDGNEWKLTLLDDSREFGVTEETASGKPGDTITLNYTGAATGANEYISVIIADKSGAQYYGRVAQTNNASGQIKIKIPASLAEGTYTLNVFSEQYNGGENDDTKLTDYASAFEAVTLNVSSDTTAPTLTGGGATRTSETAATVKFTSNEAGSYYYTVVESGAAEPDVSTSGTGTACDTTEQTISLTSLAGAGAKDIYIVVKDAAGNISGKLKIEIPAYVAPSYGISADPSALDFGSAMEGYSSAPAAQTVTITNTGNQTITLNQPTATDFNIGTLSTTDLAAGGTATFTVQPKTGLTAGNHSETLTISGSNGASAQVAISFTVTETAPATYTLTVELNGGSGATAGGEYAEGAVININAGSRSNYHFDGWTTSNGGSFSDASSASTTFTMPAANTTITANWKYNGGGGTGGSTTDYYRLTFETNGGSAIASIRRAEYTTVDLSGYKPTREGYDFTGWYADKGLTDKITSIRLTRNTTVYAGWEEKKENPSTGFENPFTDVSENDWFYDDVMFVLANDLMVGTSDNTFDPYGTTTRAMVATTIWRMEGKPEPEGDNPFTDVKNGEWYTDAIVWANENGIAVGYGNNLFGTNDPVTREQLAAFFYRYAEYKGYDTEITGSLDRFADKDDISEWAQEAMAWAVGYGIFEGRDNGMLDPQGNATRAEFAAMLHRFCEKNDLEKGVTAAGGMGWINPDKTANIPQTGDAGNSGFWLSLLLCSLAACIALAAGLKRRGGNGGDDAQPIHS